MRPAVLLPLLLLTLGCGRYGAPEPEPLSPVGSWGSWNDENDGGDADTSKEFDYVYVFNEDGSYSMTAGMQRTEGTWTQSGNSVTLDNGAGFTMEDGSIARGTTPSGSNVVLHRME